MMLLSVVDLVGIDAVTGICGACSCRKTGFVTSHVKSVVIHSSLKTTRAVPD